MSTTSVSQIGGNTYTISTGESNYLWNDKNNNGTVDAGDLVARTRQSDASMLTYVVGRDEGMIAWGDPHLDNIAFTKEGKESLTSSLNAAFADAKDGRLDNASLLGRIDQAVTTGGARDNIMDFHANMALSLTDRTRVEFKVVIDQNFSQKIAMTEAVDLDVVDVNGKTRTVTFNEIYAGNGGTGASTVMDTTGRNDLQAVASPNDLKTFHEYKGANVMHAALMFGTDAGTKDYAHVLDVDGNINNAFGKLNKESIKFYDSLVTGRDVLATAMQLGGYDEDEQKALEKANPQNIRVAAKGPQTLGIR